MSNFPEFTTVIYKTLKYLDECQKRGCESNMEILRNLLKVNDKYFRNAIEEMKRKDLIKGEIFYADNSLYYSNIKITIDGSIYLKENSAMQKVAQFIDKVFIPELNVILSLMSV